MTSTLQRRAVVGSKGTGTMERFSFIICGCLVVLATHAPYAEDIVHGPRGEAIDGLARWNESQGFSGAILAGVEDTLVLRKGYGMADREAQRPVTPDTVFDIGSLTKQFTAAAIMKLVSDGELEVTDSIAEFFENVPPDKAGITLHQLLTHASGVRDSFGDDYELIARDAYVRRALDARLAWAPEKKRYRYSNAGYSLLAAIVEIVSGQSYEEYLRTSFFDPLGMSQTGYVLPRWNTDSLAVGYHGAERIGTPLDERWDVDGPYWNLKGNGGMLSTIDDLYRWHRALRDGVVLTPSALETMFTPHQKEGRLSTHYGYGWVVRDTPEGSKLVTHNGGNDYFFADFFRYLDDDVVFIILTNDEQSVADTYDMRRIARGIEAESPGKSGEQK